MRLRLRFGAPALLWLLVATARPDCVEATPQELLPILEQAGRACLAAHHERDLEPTIAALNAVKAQLIARRISQTDASRIESALQALDLWQQYLSARRNEYWAQAGPLLAHIANSPMVQLMAPRSKIRRRLLAMPREAPRPPVAPTNLRRITSPDSAPGEFDLLWDHRDDLTEYCLVEDDNKRHGVIGIAILPPDTRNYHLPAPADNPPSEIARAVRRAAEKCLAAARPEQLDPVLRDLARYWRGARSAAQPCQRAEQTRVDVALMFVALWQDSLIKLNAGEKAEAAKLLRTLAGTDRDYPVVEPAVILRRAIALHPAGGDFVETTEVEL